MGDRVDFDRYTDNYNSLLNSETRFFSGNDAYFAKYKVDLVRARVDAPVRSVLEYGCGIGRNIHFLQQAFPGATVAGSDISSASLDTAAKDNPGVRFFHESEGAAMGDTFDLIFVAGVFHHVPIAERPAVARVLRERLTTGGSLFVFEHNPFNPLTRRIVDNCPYDEDAVLLKPGELRAILQQAGLRVRRSEYCLFVPPRLSILTWMEKYMGRLPLGGQYWVQAHG